MAVAKQFSEDEIEIIVERSKRNVPVPKIAMELERPIRSVQRVRARLGLMSERTEPYTAEQRAKILQLRSEGMISSWVAEEVGRGRDNIAKKFPLPPGAKTEWLRAWQAIRRSPAMLALHQELSPRFHTSED